MKGATIIAILTYPEHVIDHMLIVRSILLDVVDIFSILYVIFEVEVV